MAVRIEGRESANGKGYDSGRLRCTSWRAWHTDAHYTDDSEPDPKQRIHDVRVDTTSSGNLLEVDGITLELADGVDWGFDKRKKIGFMTERGHVSLTNIQVQVHSDDETE